jgi:hypothetical protein
MCSTSAASFTSIVDEEASQLGYCFVWKVWNYTLLASSKHARIRHRHTRCALASPLTVCLPARAVACPIPSHSWPFACVHSSLPQLGLRSRSDCTLQAFKESAKGAAVRLQRNTSATFLHTSFLGNRIISTSSQRSQDHGAALYLETPNAAANLHACTLTNNTAGPEWLPVAVEGAGGVVAIDGVPAEVYDFAAGAKRLSSPLSGGMLSGEEPFFKSVQQARPLWTLVVCVSKCRCTAPRQTHALVLRVVR